MKIYKIAQGEIQEPLKPVEPSQNPLNGKTNDQARNFVRKVVDAPSKGFFNDEYWKGPNGVFSALDKANIDYSIESTKYSISPNGKQSGLVENDNKEWVFTIKFTNNKSRETILHCKLVAMGGGAKEYPLSRYDIAVMIG